MGWSSRAVAVGQRAATEGRRRGAEQASRGVRAAGEAAKDRDGRRWRQSGGERRLDRPPEGGGQRRGPKQPIGAVERRVEGQRQRSEPRRGQGGWSGGGGEQQVEPGGAQGLEVGAGRSSGMHMRDGGRRSELRGGREGVMVGGVVVGLIHVVDSASLVLQPTQHQG